MRAGFLVAVVLVTSIACGQVTRQARPKDSPPAKEVEPTKQPAKQQPPKLAINPDANKSSWRRFVNWCEKNPGEVAAIGLLLAAAGAVIWLTGGLRRVWFLFFSEKPIDTKKQKPQTGDDFLNHKEKSWWFRKRRKIYCKQCDKTGMIAGNKCGFCKGRAYLYTYRLGQPDCRPCKGTGKDERGVFCSVCGGVGLMKYEHKDDDWRLN